MRLDPSQVQHLRETFAKIQTKQDFITLLNEIKPMIYGEKTVPFELKQLTWYGNPKLGGKRYFEFQIKKKSGGERNIHAPVNGLKALQKTISILLHCLFEPHQAALGFVWERSIVDNARIHVGQRFVYNLDLKDFFPSINQARVWKCLQLKPFNLNRETSKEVPQEVKYGNLLKLTGHKYFSIEGNYIKNRVSINKPFEDNRLGIANLIAAISCTEMEVQRKNDSGEWIKVKNSVLPQGAPTSPVITNIVCQRLDYLLSGLAKRFGLKYSRYADDITFSSNYNIFKEGSDFQIELNRIILDQGFYINESKTRVQGKGYRQEVTGLIVNEKVNVPKRYLKQLRMWLYFWERYGYEKASKFFLDRYKADKSHVKNDKADMARVIKGKLDYLKMVVGETSSYLKLKNRFDVLANIGGTEIKKTRAEFLEDVVDLLINDGIEKAMDLYNEKS
ncbi:reverse transcriptase family protein [Algoriphagus limi]|uniref:RNA-directed DNA polymerase n=1 Tax=Algoriphagus limi TaxID=2975273 RepID=A0ABT2G0U0_9BACT|nr:reverse transcriptase family protein [Algoriphagus limi]MCS5488889.1 reverse transcriptase family protein [Algoriphagus limi]